MERPSAHWNQPQAIPSGSGCAGIHPVSHAQAYGFNEPGH
jgi:hypothetical protein